MAQSLPDPSRSPAVTTHAKLTGAIAALICGAARDVRALALQLDAIRALARDDGRLTLASLASRAESVLARGGGTAAVRCYLDAMGEAATLDDAAADASAREALLARVAQRLHG